MPQDVTDVSTFTSPIVAVADGDAATAADFLAATQGLANRTKYLDDNKLQLDGNGTLDITVPSGVFPAVAGVGGPISATTTTAGAGLQGTGGASSGLGATGGPGLHGVGGAASNTGGIGGAGVFGQGGNGNTPGVGVLGTGFGQGAGVEGNGGSSGGPGVVGNGTSTSGQGVKGFGSGTGQGIVGFGGNSGAVGVAGIAGGTNGIGVTGAGSGGGAGVLGTGDTAGVGVAAVKGASALATISADGPIAFSTANPTGAGGTSAGSTYNGSAIVANTLYPAQVAHAWATFSANSGTIANIGGLNISSITLSGSPKVALINLQVPTSGAPAVTGTCTATQHFVWLQANSSTQLQMSLWNNSGSQLDIDSGSGGNFSAIVHSYS